MATVVNINDVLDGHVALEVECVDRLYLNAYVPNLQVSGQVVKFLTQHLGNSVASPAIFEKIGNRFRRSVDAFARDNDIPVLHLKKPDRTRWDDRKIDHVRPYLERAERDGRYGVVAIVAAQEFQWVFTGTNRATPPVVCFSFTKTERRVSTYYFYVNDPDFGAGFIKICTYFPYPAKVWGQRARVGQTPSRPRRYRLHRAGQRFRVLRRPRRPPGHLRPVRPRRRARFLQTVDGGHPHPR